MTVSKYDIGKKLKHSENVFFVYDNVLKFRLFI